MIGSRGYNAYDDRRTALYLLNNLLGGPGMNSRLNVALRERRGLVYNVESNLTSYTDTGTFASTSAATPPMPTSVPAWYTRNCAACATTA